MAGLIKKSIFQNIIVQCPESPQALLCAGERRLASCLLGLGPPSLIGFIFYDVMFIMLDVSQCFVL